MLSHQRRTASCEGPDGVHAPFAYSPPAREQVAAESAQAGDAEDGDDEGRADSGDGSRPFPVDRRMPFLTLTVLAAFA